MAKNYNGLSDEEKKKRILQIADYIIETKSSTRKTAKYFKENFFPISNATVHEYMHTRLIKIDLEKYRQVMGILKENSPKSIDEIEVKIRVLRASSLSLQDFTSPEIAQILHSTVDIIYHDLTERLPKIDEKIGKEVSRKLNENRFSNLTQFTNEVPVELIDEFSQKSQRGH